MSGQGNESRPIINNIYGGQGGNGGRGGVGGGHGGTGEGPTFSYSTVGNMTNNIVNQGQGLEQVLYKWLESPPDTKDRQHELKSLHHDATGGWLLRDDRFVRWKDTPGALWIKGISGTGKSILSSTIVEEIVQACPERSAVTYFYFDFRNERQRMDIMLCSIVWQLSGWSHSPYSSLHQLHETLGKGTIKPQRVHLQEVLENLLSELDQTYIVIDGLDECNMTDWKQLIEFIHSLCQHPKTLPHLLFTSQPHEDFKNAFKDVPSIELGSTASAGDIRSFLSSKVPGARNWITDDRSINEVTEQIVQKSNGMFRMAACLLIELEHCYEDEWQETLTALPSDLFSIYSRFLTRAKASLKSAFIQAIFRWLVFSARQVTADELADAISFRLDAPTFDFADPAKSTYYPKRRLDNSDNFKLLEGLIVIKDGSKRSEDWFNNNMDEPTIVFAHSSVKDYILSTGFHQEFGSLIDLTKVISHKFITQTCVRYLLLFAEPQHSMTKEALQDYPIALYAAKYWFHHLRLCNNQDQDALLPLTMRLLEDGSSQHAALYQLGGVGWYGAHMWDNPISPAVCMCSELGYIEGVRSLLIEHNGSVDLVNQYGQTALHLALNNRHLDIARLLIECNASVDLVSQYGQTALHLALHNSHLDIARLLIEHNASVDLVHKDGETALHFASRKGYLDIARMLVERNASIDLVNIDGETALHLASHNDHLNLAQLLIEHNASVDLVNQYSQTALHLALNNRHLDIARLLIECNVSVDLVDNEGETVLHLALDNGHPDIATMLIERIASVDLVDKYGQTALHLASYNGYLNIARMLIEHNASVDLVGQYGQTALHLALHNGHLDIARLLIECNASVDLVNKDGETVLHLASCNGYLDIARMLIERNASVNLVDINGKTALHLASCNGHLDLARLLIEHNGSVNFVNQYGQAALHLAVNNHHFDIARLLIEHNVSVDLVDNDGETALHLALDNGCPDIAMMLIERNASVDLVNQYGQTALHLALNNHHLNIARLLIEHNASVDSVGRYGQTALHLALENGHLDIARLLIEHNASIDLVNEDGETALHLALDNGHPDIATMLIERNTSVDLVDKYGWTVLHLASRNGYLNIVRMLIERNVSVDLVDKHGKTALHLALSKGHLDIARLLVEHNASVD